MCYSAMVKQDLKVLGREQKATVDLAAFERLFEARLQGAAIEVPRALESNFNLPRDPVEQRIRDLIENYRNLMRQKHREGVEHQTTRLADAERRFTKTSSKSAETEIRRAKSKIKWHAAKAADLDRVQRDVNDARIYPKWYAPVILLEGRDRVIRPMRYLCRPENMPTCFYEDGERIPYEFKFNGNYNARRDNLEKFWRQQFGHRHAYMVITSFFENVELHRFEQRELGPDEAPKSLVIHFNPQPAVEMKVACLWSHNEVEGELPLESFAAITDEPPPEVAAAGHDRCLIPLNEDALEVWLRPESSNAGELQAALDNRVRPFYEHRLAA
jgi:putative SOS response-associated peptidase YedK